MFKIVKRSALLCVRIGPTVATFRPATAQRWSPTPRRKSDWIELGGYARGRWGDAWYWVFDSLAYDVRQSKGRKRRLHCVAPGSSCNRQPAVGVTPPPSLALAGVDRGWSRTPPLSRFYVFQKTRRCFNPFLIYRHFFFVLLFNLTKPNPQLSAWWTINRVPGLLISNLNSLPSSLVGLLVFWLY